ncbi:MAG: aspartate kinase [Candidatus Bathyarchaeia archaeon]
MRLVMKFGGTSVADGERIRHAAGLVKDSVVQGNKVAVVVSAMGSNTDDLLSACDMATRGDQKAISRFVEDFTKKHTAAASKAVDLENIQERVRESINLTSSELSKVLTGVGYLGELTPRIKDYILSFGERLVAPILWGALLSIGVQSEWFTGKDAGILTDSKFGEARPLLNMCRYHVRERLGPLLERSLTPVVTGFIAADQNGVVTTLGRGGSDLTATILGSALRADEVWIWSDVDGLMTADPRIEPSAKTIPELSYQEAMEMAYFGAKMMPPVALEVALEDNIPIRIRNTFNPKNQGTRIIGEQSVAPQAVAKAASLIRKVALVTVSGASILGTPTVAAKLFDLLGKNNLNVLMITQGSSEANISFVVRRNDLDKVLNLLETALLGGDLVRDISAEDDVCIVALVGAGMRGTPGVASRVFGAVAREKINIRMIAQGSSELNISFVVKESDGERAVRALHREFELGK